MAHPFSGANLRKGLAAAVAAAVFLTVPGAGCYEALAQVNVAGSGAGVSVVPGGASGAALSGLGSAGAVSLNALPAGVSLTGSLVQPGLGLPAPTTLPSARAASFSPSAAVPAAAHQAPAALPGSALNPAPRPDAARAPGTAVQTMAASPVTGGAPVGIPGSVRTSPEAAEGRVAAALPRVEPVGAHNGAPSFRSMLADRRSVALPIAELESLPAGSARASGAALFDRILGLWSAPRSAAAVPVPGRASGEASRHGLRPAAGSLRDGGSSLPGRHQGPGGGTSSPHGSVAASPFSGQAAPAPQGPAGKALRAALTIARIGGAAAAVVGLQAAAVAFLPGLFGFLPAAAVWSVSSGALLLPVALHSRYRLALRDSARLKGVKRVMDLALGAFIGAAVVAFPAFTSGALSALALPLPLIAGASAVGMATARMPAASNSIFDGLIAWGALGFLAPLLGAVAHSPLTAAGLFGLWALPVATTVSFFLGRLVHAAETGRPFAIPGGPQKIRFPAYTWVMTGVVFALLTGYAPVWTNWAFFFWMFLGDRRVVAGALGLDAHVKPEYALPFFGILGNSKALSWLMSNAFDLAFLGALGWSVATGFSAPITFLVLAFAPERAANWTEHLLARLLKPGNPAPSTRPSEGFETLSEKPAKWPKLFFWAKTIGLTLGLAALGFGVGFYVAGFSSLLINGAIATAMALIPFFFAKKIIKLVMRAEPTDEARDPEVFAIMRDLRALINVGLEKKGKRPIPMPEIVNVPMPVPNAFATGRSPYNAMVGVTLPIKDMTLNPESVRQGTVRAIAAAASAMSEARGKKEAEAAQKAFAVLSIAIRGSVRGIPAGAGPAELARAVQAAPKEEVRALGQRALRGVLGHEFSHVMDRHMLLGAVAGALSSMIAFTSYGVLWAVGHARALLVAALRTVLGRGKPRAGEPSAGATGSGRDGAVDGSRAEGVQPEVVEPVSTGAAAVVGLAWLAKTFAALWAPLMATILQMGASRSNEGMADEDGALLTGDPEALALGLALLATWRPAFGFRLARADMPIIASQSHVMTVNPMDQLAGTSGLSSSAVSRADDAFFNLFITHPDTRLRIARLHDMAAANRASARPASDDSAGSAPGTLRHAGEGASEGVDPEAGAALSTPGLDAAMVPVVEAFQAELEASPEKGRKLGHLLWALQEVLRSGWVVRYAKLEREGESLSSIYDPAAKAIFINDMLRRVNPQLQGGLLAAQLQQVYDYLVNRSGNTQEALVRQVSAQDAFLEGADGEALAAGLDINNPAELELFESEMRTRLWAASGLSALQQIFHETLSVPQIVAKGRDHVALLEKQLRDLEDQLQLVQDEGLRREPGNEKLLKQKKLLTLKIGMAKGTIRVAKAQLAMAEREGQGRPGASLDTPLAVDQRRAARDFDLRVVPNRESPQVEARVQPILSLIRSTIASSRDADIKKLGYLLSALDKLLASGGRVRFAPPGDDAAAYFSPVTLDLVVGRQFLFANPALVAALMVHELTHVADYFGVPRPGETRWSGRPMTRETEKNAFTNEAVFIGAFDPEEIAAKMDPRNPMEEQAFDLVYHARTRYLEGNTSLEAMISQAYTSLFGAHFEGLQTATQLIDELKRRKVEPMRQAYEDLQGRAELVERSLRSSRDPMRSAQLDQMNRALAVYRAYLRLYERQIEQLEAAARESGEIAAADRATARGSAASKGLGAASGGRGRGAGRGPIFGSQSWPLFWGPRSPS